MADILIVDDDVDLAEAVAAVLESLGHTTRTVPDGRAGLAAMSERLPDAVVLDVEMPVLDGPGMAAAMLVEDCGRERIPIVLSSGYAEVRAIAARIGTPYVLPKPCSVDALALLVARALDEKIAPRPAAASHDAHPR